MKYVHTYKDRHGKTVHYFRRGSEPRIRLPEPRTLAFERLYRALFAQVDDSADSAVVLRSFRDKPDKPKIGLERRRARRSSAGVYLLLLDDRVVYVGTSVDMATRVTAHRANGRQFDRAYYIHVPRAKERLALERSLIAAIRPDQNSLRTVGG